VVAIYENEGDDEEELGFHEGDEIIVLGHVNDDWMTGRNMRTGEEGIFPSIYTTEKEE